MLVNRQFVVDFIVDDLRDWLEREPETFWEHVSELERQHLETKTDAQLLEMYADSF